MPQIVAPGQFNPASLGADDLYIQILNPPSYIRGVPTDVVGFVGTASWGPVNTAVHMGSAQDGATAFGQISAVSVTDPYDLATDVVLAFGQASSQASLEGWGVRVTDGTDTAAAATLTGSASSAPITETLSGTVATGDKITLTVTSSAITGSPVAVSYISGTGGTLATFAAGLAAAINANPNLAAAGIFASAASAVISIYQPTALSPQATVGSVVNTGTETVTPGTGTATSNGITLDAIYTGVLGNQVQVLLQAGTVTGSWTASVVPPSGIGLTEVFPNLSGTGFWGALQNAINFGISGVRGPSLTVKAVGANNAVGAPSAGTTSLSGGTDGRTGVVTATLLGSDTAFPKTGLYALRGLKPAVGIVWIVGSTDQVLPTSLKAFGTSEGCSTLFPFATGTTTAVATAAVATIGVRDASFAYAKDWIYWFDSINNQLRLNSPVPVIAGTWATYSPEQSPGNKPVSMIVGTDRNPPNQPGIPYTESEIAQLEAAGILLITNPIPAGQVWGIRHGQSTSLLASTTPLEWWRLTAYLARSFAGTLGQFVDQLQSQQPNDPVRNAIKLQLNTFLATLKGNRQIDNYVTICTFSSSASAKPGNGMNTPASVAQHYLYAMVQITYLSSIRFFILSLQGGTTVVTVNGQGANNLVGA